jgi:DNA-binding NtrC family response regulator
MAKQGRLIIVDDNRGILSAVKLLTEKHFASVVGLSSPNLLISELRLQGADVVLLDMNFTAGINSGNEGLYWLKQVVEKFPETKVVLFTAYADIDLAVKSMQFGAVDFVVKPWDNDRLIASLRNAYNMSQGENRKRKKESNARDEVPMFWGQSEAMSRVRDVVDKVAVTDANILITGENGTGKEVLAREIHRRSLRRQSPMVSIDMGAIPESLFESELFGHKKGAFTDAHTDREGKFITASGGTLFLDEIGNLSQQSQQKMLVALQNRSIVPLGSDEAVAVDIRLIAATNRDLFKMVGEGDFRQDLLYRINTIHIELPPLRQRKEDILPLAEIFLTRYANRYNKGELRFTEEAQQALKEYVWEGNIRELQHTVEKAVIMAENRDVDVEQLRLQPIASSPQKAEGSTLEEMERRMISEAIASSDGNMTTVAQQLGISRQTLYNKIKRYGL